VLVTLAAAGLARFIAPDYAASAVGLTFLGSAYWFALHTHGDSAAREFGLALGGLLERAPLSFSRLARGIVGSVAWALVFGAIVFPAFWVGYWFWFRPTQPFSPVLGTALLDDVLGQVLVIALPEEAFYRGYVQSSLDRHWTPRWSILGAKLGPAWIFSSALFAIGHVLAEPDPGRLAVFFPGLVFGWLRARSGSVGPGIAFHAACNLFASFLGQGYGFTR
jgi:uncharacterized protein